LKTLPTGRGYPKTASAKRAILFLGPHVAIPAAERASRSMAAAWAYAGGHGSHRRLLEAGLSYVLERHFECWLLNAQHLHKVPGERAM